MISPPPPVQFTESANGFDASDIVTYRLMDGTYLIGDEVALDSESNMIMVGRPAQINFSIAPNGIEVFEFRQWMLVDSETPIVLSSNAVIARIEATPALAHLYFRYLKAQIEIRNHLMKQSSKPKSLPPIEKSNGNSRFKWKPESGKEPTDAGQN